MKPCWWRGGWVRSGGFEPFGRDYTTPSAGHAGVFLRFAGQWDDATWSDISSGYSAYYNLNRWYGPATGGYAEPDPLGVLSTFPQLSYLYSYALDRPTLLVDPDGRDTLTDDPHVQDCAYCLQSLALSAGPHSKIERAMGIYCRQGSMDCEILPAGGVPGQETQRLDTRDLCGFFHTHPVDSSARPSVNDTNAADRLFRQINRVVPFYVVHPTGGISKYTPPAGAITVEAKTGWVEGPKGRKKPCDGIPHP